MTMTEPKYISQSLMALVKRVVMRAETDAGMILILYASRFLPHASGMDKS